MITKAKLCKDSISGNVISAVITKDDGKEWAIPFDPDNTDYANFKKDLANGAELQDAEGNVFTLEKVKEYLGTLP
jgi:hypothetical protein